MGPTGRAQAPEAPRLPSTTLEETLPPASRAHIQRAQDAERAGQHGVAAA